MATPDLTLSATFAERAAEFTHGATLQAERGDPAAQGHILQSLCVGLELAFKAFLLAHGRSAGTAGKSATTWPRRPRPRPSWASRPQRRRSPGLLKPWDRPMPATASMSSRRSRSIFPRRSGWSMARWRQSSPPWKPADPGSGRFAHSQLLLRLLPEGFQLRCAGGVCVSASVARVDTAVMSCAGAKGLARMTLPGTPLDAQSLTLSPLM